MREVSSLKAQPKLPNGSTFPLTATILIDKHHTVGSLKDLLNLEYIHYNQLHGSTVKDGDVPEC
jgi:hypothetical protein